MYLVILGYVNTSAKDIGCTLRYNVVQKQFLYYMIFNFNFKDLAFYQ